MIKMNCIVGLSLALALLSTLVQADTPSPTPTPGPSSLPAITAVFSDNFAGSTLDTSKWATTIKEGTGTVANNALTISDPNGKAVWEAYNVFTVSTFPRVNASGAPLVCQYDASFYDGNIAPVIGFVPSTVTSTSYTYGSFANSFMFFGWFMYVRHLVSGASAAAVYQGPLEFTKVPNNVGFRITLDPVQGALYQDNLNDGNGWLTLLDTRGNSAEDNSASYYFAIDPVSYGAGGIDKTNSTTAKFAISNVQIGYPVTVNSVKHWTME